MVAVGSQTSTKPLCFRWKPASVLVVQELDFGPMRQLSSWGDHGKNVSVQELDFGELRGELSSLLYTRSCGSRSRIARFGRSSLRDGSWRFSLEGHAIGPHGAQHPKRGKEDLRCHETFPRLALSGEE